MKRKNFFVGLLIIALVVAWATILFDEKVRDRLGNNFYILGFAITGCMVLVLATIIWDQTFTKTLKTLRDTTDSVKIDEMPGPIDGETESDEIIGLARKIERMARSLQHVEASYKGIVEDQPDLICRYRNDGRMTFVNGAYARAMNRKRSELVGVDFPYFAPGAAIADEPYTFETDMPFSDGRRLWIRWTQRAIKDDERTTIEYQSVGHDITERKEAEAALLRAKEAAEAADRAKSEFLAIVSHELRTPINAIIGFSKMLTSTQLSGDQKEQVEMINSSGLALEKIIADILNLSKIDSGKIDIEHAPFSIRTCVQEICAFFAPKARSLALALDSKVDAGVPEVVNSDEQRIRQILTNLIGNALKFTERGGVSLEVSCARGEPIEPGSPRRVARLFFAVKDSGIGIPSEKLELLFQPFSQVDSSTTRRRGGTGLGLIISKRLCELMGGTISVESRVAEGSTFRFSILTDYEEA
ncbi:MAG TPA: ATP-binding protein [Opitutaceae bacterium]|jgi:PAS domain S-box-containing protein